MNEEIIKELFEKVRIELKEIGIPISENIQGISINKRTKKRLGACKIEKRPMKAATYRIEISSIVLNCNEVEIKTVIAHELLHTCPGCFDHGKKWKEYGKLVENVLGYEIKRVIKYEDIGIHESANVERVKYIILCPSCGQKYERKRMCPLVKNPENYRCGKCGSRFI